MYYSTHGILKNAISILGKAFMIIEQTIFGPLLINEPILIDLINTKAMQRLKKINQFGISYYTNKPVKFTRYSHSLGVLHLLTKINASLEEQIAGLLHDVSHTVFSHVGDLVFEHDSVLYSYQDDIHHWYLDQTDIPNVLADYGLTTESILHKNEVFQALEKDLPQLCADRLEYIIHEGFLEQLFTKQDVQNLYQSLQFINGHWVIHNQALACKLAQTALYLTKRHWAAPWNVACYHWGATALKRAMQINIITINEFHFGYDDDIWHRLKTSTDHTINQLMYKMMHSPVDYSTTNECKQSVHIKPKFRGIDPLVHIDKDRTVYLSELDKDFKQAFCDLKMELEQGFFLNL